MNIGLIGTENQLSFQAMSAALPWVEGFRSEVAGWHHQRQDTTGVRTDCIQNGRGWLRISTEGLQARFKK
jgi:hypothetical protein